ncbi:MAG: EAL domain-containing protein, partial [Gammaproteobacteria bacterium]|nr:EAL domain-containing protein [Gammaproteobacteria bacterium]
SSADQFHIKSILLRGPDASLITGAYEENAEPYNGCPVVIDKISVGNSEARQKTKFVLCTQSNKLMAEVVVASGSQESEAYIHVIAYLNNELISMDKTIGSPVTISDPQGALQYQSPDWAELKQSSNISNPVLYTLYGDDHVPGLVISTIYDQSQLVGQLESNRLSILRVAGIFIGIALVVALILLLYIFKPVDFLRKSLGKLDNDHFVPIKNTYLPAELQDFASVYNKIIMVLEDASDKHIIASKDLLSERDFISKTLDSITSSVVVVNSELVIKLVNPAFEKLLGEYEENLVGYPFSEIIVLYANRSASHIADLTQMLKNPQQIQRLYYQQDGDIKELDMIASPMLDMDSEDIGFVLIFKDVTEGNELRRKLNYEVRHDKLTGLLNRVAFESKFDEIISDVYISQSQHVLVTIDIDDFRVISQSCGGDAGDLLIKQVAEVLSHSVRKSDLLACLGGDEFGLILAYADMEIAAKTVSNILANICKKRFSWNGIEYPVTASAALIAFGQINDDFSEVFSNLTNSCSLAKQQGGNQYYLVGDNDINVQEHHTDLTWVARINKGFTENRFKLYVQPIVSVQENAGKPFYEVLIRYLANDGEIILPAEFLGAAERFNLIEKIDRWVISEVTHWLAVNSDIKGDIVFSINISGRSIRSSSFQRFIYQLLQTALVDGHNFCFETKDITVVKDLDNTFEFIKNVNELGAKFSLDNFGSGLFSLANLKEVPADYLKIDGMIINNLLKDGYSSVVIRSIAEVAHSLGMKVIAESVESKDMLQKLSEAKVDYLQGDAISKPLPIESIDINQQWNVE